jgi:hypothetical protein
MCQRMGCDILHSRLICDDLALVLALEMAKHTGNVLCLNKKGCGILLSLGVFAGLSLAKAPSA